MDAKELRLGNYVLFNDKVVKFVWNDFEDNASGLKPIPINKEWLFKFGFNKHITSDLYPTFSKGVINVNDGVIYIIGFGFLNHIKYIHQLQNLYLLLTNKELICTQDELQ